MREAPGARAFGAGGKAGHDRHALDVVEREGAGRRGRGVDRDLAGDGDLGKVEAVERGVAAQGR